jgi:hypothetical protein
MTTVQLTDSEWMSLIDGSEHRTGNLGKCCANVSALRDTLISLAREGGETNVFTGPNLRRHLGWVLAGHEVAEIPALVKVAQQLGVDLNEARHEVMRGPEAL